MKQYVFILSLLVAVQAAMVTDLISANRQRQQEISNIR